MTPRLWIEPFAGSAAAALYLLAGLRPPVGYMGSKRRFAARILAHLGYAAGDGCEGLLLCDAGPWGWVWPVLLDPERCLRVAAILRGWRHEDPRKLWDRLVSEPIAEDLEEMAGRYLWIQARSAAQTPVWFADGWVMNARVNGSATTAARKVCQKGTREDGGGGVSRTSTVATRLEHLAAAFLALSAGSYAQKPVTIRAGAWKTAGFGGLISDASRERGFPERMDLGATSNRVVSIADSRLPHAVVYQGRAEDIQPWDYHDRDVVYLDPPYQGCTGYAADCAREAVVDLAWAWHNAGATVVISEAVPLEIERWHHVEITDCARAGLGKGGMVLKAAKREWLTMNRSPRPVFAGTALFRGAA